MLDELHVSNIALIEDVTIEFSSGLTVLTGETGAGKTALLAALQLICGARADAGVVRDGSDEALAEARILDAGEHVVRRRVSARGRSRCTIDGQMATVTELAQATTSIEVHGQHDQVQLLQAARQLAYLDSWSGNQDYIDAYQSARSSYLKAREALAAVEEASDAAETELEFMRFTCEQIEKVNPREGEYEELKEELPRLQHAEQLGRAVANAHNTLHGDGAALDMLAQAVSELENERGIDSDLDDLAERLSSLERELEDLTRDIGSYAQGIHYDPYSLDELLTRMDALAGIMKRFGPGMDQVMEAWDNAKRMLARAEISPFELEQAQKRVQVEEEKLREAASALSEIRRAGAARFCTQLADAVVELAMEGAGFEFSFEELPFDRWTELGSERIELMYRPAQAASLRPLGRIASGGELSRILLAIECMHYGANSSQDAGSTIVFDEIDSGIGGATGAAVARRLAALSRSAQVIVVTHLPQVAAVADEHYVVSKQQVSDALPHTLVDCVRGEDRVAEIARMLAGADDDAARDHARQLLSGASAL